MVKTLETNLAEREAMIRILQSSKTVNNSNDILNKVVAGQAAAAALMATSGADMVGTGGSLTQAQIKQFGAAAAVAQQQQQQLHMLTASSAATPNASFHQKQLSTPLPLSSGLHSVPLPNPQHQQFKSISLNSTPTRNLTSLPYNNTTGTLSIHNPLAHGRSLTPSADMLLLRSSEASSAFRSSTPGVDFFSRHQPSTQLQSLDQLKSMQMPSRRESAPADILNSTNTSSASGPLHLRGTNK